MGMLTFSTRAYLSDEALYAALEKKVAGAIRSTISNCSQPAQSVLLKALSTPEILDQRRRKKCVLQKRAQRVRQILSRPEHARLWEPYPFNAGYFMCLRLKGIDAEAFRKHLLENYGVGVIADGDRDIRIAFSAVDEPQLEDLFATLAAAARELQQSRSALRV